jgi:ABC-type transport system involved in multi-copper enzyme maturation permease subunit
MMPILRKELRALMRERRGFFVPVLYALLLALMTGLNFIGARSAEVSPVLLGKNLALTVVGLQSAAVLLFSPLVGGSMIASERERGTLARLLSSSVSRDGIVIGKIAASCLYLFLLLSISFPLAALSLLFGGLDVATLAGLYLTNIWVAASLVSPGVAVSAGFNRTWAASLLALGLTLALVVGLPIIGLAGAAFFKSAIPGSVYAAAGQQHAETLMRAVGWLDPAYGLKLLFGGAATRFDWFAHYTAMLLLGVGSFVLALSRLRRAGS